MSEPLGFVEKLDLAIRHTVQANRHLAMCIASKEVRGEAVGDLGEAGVALSQALAALARADSALTRKQQR